MNLGGGWDEIIIVHCVVGAVWSWDVNVSLFLVWILMAANDVACLQVGIEIPTVFLVCMSTFLRHDHALSRCLGDASAEHCLPQLSHPLSVESIPGGIWTEAVSAELLNPGRSRVSPVTIPVTVAISSLLNPVPRPSVRLSVRMYRTLLTGCGPRV